MFKVYYKKTQISRLFENVQPRRVLLFATLANDDFNFFKKKDEIGIFRSFHP